MEAKELLNYIDEEIPADRNVAWKKGDALARMYITTLLKGDPMDLILSLDTARDIIVELKRMYCRDNSRHQLQIKKQMLSLKFDEGKEDVIKFLAEFERLITLL